MNLITGASPGGSIVIMQSESNSYCYNPAVLSRVEIERYSLIEDMAVEFSGRFNAVSGETGAGKTLLLDAIDFALGARASSQIFPASGGRCRVKLSFDVKNDLNLQGLVRLKKGEHTLDRIARPGGSGRILLDGEKISTQAARELSAALLDYSGQAENRQLLTPRAHRAILDAFGDNAHAKLLEEYKTARGKYLALSKQLEIIDRGEAARNAKVRLLEIEISELRELAVEPHEHERLSEMKTVLANANRIMEEAERTREIIAGEGEGAQRNDGAAGVRERLVDAASAARSLSELLGRDSESGEQWMLLAEELDKMEAGLGEVESSAVKLLSVLKADPVELERIQSRLAGIDRLSVKYGTTPDGLAAELETRADELGSLSGGDFDRQNVARELESCAAECDRIARAMSKSRTRAAKVLEKRVSEFLERLDFAHSHFEVAGFLDFLDYDADSSEESSIDAASNPNASNSTSSFREAGYDDIEFLVSLNPDEPARPLARVASGGEMSRLMLAITAALAEHTSTPVLMFDEIEAGVGGLTSQAVADVLTDVANVRQVIAVTHLAQVAGRADRHFAVTKDILEKKAETPAKHSDAPDTGLRLASHIIITELEGHPRREELARMLGTADTMKAKAILDEIMRE